MRILVVAATLLEIAPMVRRRTPDGQSTDSVAPGTMFKLPDADVLITGVGGIQCAAHVARILAVERYDLIVQAGIAGSFSAELPKLSLVKVVSEECADLGAEDKGGFLHLSEMGLLDPEQFPLRSGRLYAPDLKIEALARVTPARSVTVNRALSEERSINWIRQRFNPDVVNMEGAGFFYAALFAGVEFVSLRTISDMVGPRNKEAWDIPGAVRTLDAALESVLVECKARA